MDFLYLMCLNAISVWVSHLVDFEDRFDEQIDGDQYKIHLLQSQVSSKHDEGIQLKE